MIKVKAGFCSQCNLLTGVRPSCPSGSRRKLALLDSKLVVFRFSITVLPVAVKVLERKLRCCLYQSFSYALRSLCFTGLGCTLWSSESTLTRSYSLRSYIENMCCQLCRGNQLVLLLILFFQYSLPLLHTSGFLQIYFL